MRFPLRIVSVTLCLGASLLVGCSSDEEPTTTTVVETLAPVVTTTTPTTTAMETTALPTTVPETPTTAPPPVTMAPTTTVAPTTTIAATTTTVPVGAALSLDDDGIGDSVFGNDPDLVVSYISGILGGPAEDSGWVDAITRTCPGTEVRLVRWGDLTLFFGDDTSVTSEFRHFFAWSFGPPADFVQSPAGLTTPTGIRLGSTVADVGRAYPGARLFSGDDLGTASIQINDDLFAFVTSSEESGVVTAILGGQGCGA